MMVAAQTLSNSANVIIVTSGTVYNYSSHGPDMAMVEWNAADTAAKTQYIPPPRNGVTGARIVIKDGQGNAATYNITVLVFGSLGTIDDGSSYVISQNYGSVILENDGSGGYMVVAQANNSIGVSNPAAVVTAGGGIPYGFQIVGNRGIVQGYPGRSSDFGLAANRIEIRRQFVNSSAPISQVTALIQGFLMNPNGEILLGNDYTSETCVEKTTVGVSEELFSYGTNTPTIPAATGTSFVPTNPCSYIFAAGETFELRQGLVFPANSSNFVANLYVDNTTTDFSCISSSGISQVNGTGAMSVPVGGVATSTSGESFMSPILIGKSDFPVPSVLIVGDSIPLGIGDYTASNGSFRNGDVQGNSGFAARGLAGVKGFTLHMAKETIGSWQLQFTSSQYAPKMRYIWSYATHIIVAMGTNDIAASQTLSQLQTNLTALLTDMKEVFGPYGKPPKIAVSTIMPRTTSTDLWATAVNQSPATSGFAIGGTRDTYNAWIKTQVGLGLIDAVIDVNPFVQDPVVTYAWLTNGTANYPTTDGTHPSTALHILAAQAVNAWAVGIAP